MPVGRIATYGRAKDEVKREIAAAGRPRAKRGSPREMFLDDDWTWLDTEAIWGMTPAEMREAVESLKSLHHRAMSRPWRQRRRRELLWLRALAEQRWAAAQGLEIVWF